MEVCHHLVCSRRALSAALVAIAVTCGGPPALAQSDPLPSWNDTPAKQAIVDFVTKTTKEGSTTFVPPEERIATFDQDGLVGRAPDVQPGHLLPRPGSCAGR